jgi:hypothetical protein
MKKDKTFFILGDINSVIASSTDIYDYTEKYNYSKEILEDGKYWMGSQTSNTRCNRFTLLGADKKYADDTKEKK